MERCIEPSAVKGQIKAPSSKSMTQRAIAAALLADGQSIINNPSYCDDSLAAMSMACGLGAKVDPTPGELKVNGQDHLKNKSLIAANQAWQSGCFPLSLHSTLQSSPWAAQTA